MHLGCALLFWMAGAMSQDPQEEPPPKPVVEVPAIPPVEPKPLYSGGDLLMLRTIALRPRWELKTREFDFGMFSGAMDVGEVADFERTSIGIEARADLGNWTVSATAMFQSRRTLVGKDTTFEQHTFEAGSAVDTTAFFGTVEAYHRFDVYGGPAETARVSLLLGINFSKFLLSMEDDRRYASEGFSALWPLPALGVEAKVWLMDRLSVSLSARGTRFRYDNPFQLDAGGSQDIRYLYGRFDAGLEWRLSESFSISAGYTGIDAYVEAASAEDADSVDLKAGGVFGGVSLFF
jgi:hypothetical protein